ncbi:MAG: GGDEF domain-containing protein [Deltaproteobacteria bacterium]|nr:MAG: GGDEF domain-containing protein [Deltaproteobacteria bacterium]
MPGSQERAREILNVLFGITQRMAQGAQLEETLGELAEAAARAVEAESASVLLLDEERAALLARATYGLPPEEARDLSFRLGEGIAGWVAEQGVSLRLPDARRDPRFKHIEGQKTEIVSMCTVPLATREGAIGVITVTAPKPDHFDEEDERVLTFLAGSVVKDVENARLYRLAVTDSLTRAYNRQYLSERLPEEIERHRRYGDSISVVLFDVDHFKRVNDVHGHAAGDAVLVAIADLARELCRETDSVVRYGGEEFLLLLPKTGREGARQLADRLRRRVAHHVVTTEEGAITVTLSAGVAEVQPEEEAQSLLARADAALYLAKRRGRNRVEVAGL